MIQEKNKFIWILSYDGPGDFETKDSAYYASQSRTTLKPDPADYIADSEKYFINTALPELEDRLLRRRHQDSGELALGSCGRWKKTPACFFQ